MVDKCFTLLMIGGNEFPGLFLLLCACGNWLVLLGIAGLVEPGDSGFGIAGIIHFDYGRLGIVGAVVGFGYG